MLAVAAVVALAVGGGSAAAPLKTPTPPQMVRDYIAEMTPLARTAAKITSDELAASKRYYRADEMKRGPFAKEFNALAARYAALGNKLNAVDTPAKEIVSIHAELRRAYMFRGIALRKRSDQARLAPCAYNNGDVTPQSIKCGNEQESARKGESNALQRWTNAIQNWRARFMMLASIMEVPVPKEVAYLGFPQLP